MSVDKMEKILRGLKCLVCSKVFQHIHTQWANILRSDHRESLKNSELWDVIHVNMSQHVSSYQGEFSVVICKSLAMQ